MDRGEKLEVLVDKTEDLSKSVCLLIFLLHTSK